MTRFSCSWTIWRQPKVPDAREIADALQARGVKLALGNNLYDPAEPMGKMFFNVLATFAEFKWDLIRLRTREGMTIAGLKGSGGENSLNSFYIYPQKFRMKGTSPIQELPSD